MEARSIMMKAAVIVAAIALVVVATATVFSALTLHQAQSDIRAIRNSFDPCKKSDYDSMVKCAQQK